ncbi:unnamed protein product [Rotaria sp. Silwood2]|nr:unnamed protein product [Rotaria sp. Silwood2]CAF4185949.1 unnamed protein product [Rotaria sp. Silwood2]
MAIQFHTDSSEEIDEHEQHSNIIATRVYIVPLSLCLFGMGLVLWLNYKVVSITIQNPTIAGFKTLALTANSPRVHVSSLYAEFVSLHPTFHQVCSSDFVSGRWIEIIFTGTKATYFVPYDFRNQGSAIFQALVSFCRLSQVNVLNSIAAFNASSFINLYALPKVIL